MNVQDVDLNLLRVFDTVLRDRSVTLAAARLGLTQPAVSNSLARLRRLLGDALFVRTPDGMRPTPIAQDLADPIRQALGLVETALARNSGFDPAGSTRTFRFHMSDIGEMVFLPALVERLRRVAPGVRVEATALALEEITDALGAGTLDLAVGALPGLTRPIRTHLLFRDAYVCMTRADHPAIGRTLSQRQFSAVSHALVSSPGGGHRVVEDTLAEHGLTGKIALRVPHFTVVPMVLARTDLVLTVPGRAAKILEQDGRLKSLKLPVPMPKADVGIHWHERFERDPGNTWLRELMVQLFAD
ncbi:MAG TPA: LysR family transcriptional regulator [Burkholderiales bacterium]|nr:LysR family transcriptional regulator [Burkholderiales bacterium]